jgi:hypothetical protein
MAIEASVLALGKVVGEKAGRAWLARRSSEADRNKELTELIAATFRDQIARRRLARQLEDIADSVAERILSLCGHEYHGMTDNDKAAVLLEAADILAKSDLSDKALFAADADPRKLARDIRAKLPARRLDLSFGEPEINLLDAVLEECCIYIVTIVRELPQFNQRATGEILSRLSGMAEQVGSVLTRLPARSLYAPDGPEGDKEFRALYLGHLSNALDTLELFGVRIERYRPRTTLTVAYISLSVSTEDIPEADPNAPTLQFEFDGVLKTPRDSDLSTVRVEAALSANRLTLIRGEAGSGKSTLLRWLAINAARGGFIADLEDWNGCVPFLVKLRSYASRDLPTPEQFLDGVADLIVGLMPRGWVHRQLNSGRVILLIDGVDELPARQRRSVRSWLGSLVSTYPAIRVVVTSRPAAAGSDWLKTDNFATAFLERMSKSDLRSLVRHWHEAARDCGDIPCPPERLPSYEKSLLARLEKAPHLQSLATSPLLAAMLCALNLDRETQLPPSRIGLYQAALELLLERRDVERQVPTEVSLEADQKIRILQDLAWRLSVTGRSEIPKSVAERRVADAIASMPRISASPDAILDYLIQRSGVIREPAVGRIDFVHRTVQEYLTAKQATDDGDMESLIDAAHRDQWRETIIMAAGHANAPMRHQLLAGILERIKHESQIARRLKLLLGACLETLLVVPPDLSPAIDQCLLDLIPPRNVTAARTIANIGEPVLAKFPLTLDGLSDAVGRATVRAAWMVNGPQAVEVLSRYSNESRVAIQRELLEAWQYFDSEEFARRVLSGMPRRNLRISARHLAQFHALKHLSEIEVLDLRLRDTFSSRINLLPLSKFRDSLRVLTIQLDSPADGMSVITQLEKLDNLSLAIPLTDIDFVDGMCQVGYLGISDLSQVRNFGPLRGQGKLKNLSLTRANHLTDLSDLPALDKIAGLYITQSSLSCGLAELVAAAPAVHSLSLQGSAWLDNLSALSGLSLNWLTLWGCTNLLNFDPIATQNQLAYLDLEGTKVSDLNPLSDLRKLSTLWLKDCTEIDNLGPLEDLPLRRLFIQGVMPGIDLAPIKKNRRLILTVGPEQEIRNRESFEGRIQVDAPPF